ncbi:DUF5641 domain-containing protein, partial [Nephila pilipes]
RGMLNLVMKNAIKGRVKTDLKMLHDELEGKLRAIESQGRTQEKYGDFLILLVESCLPEDVLLAWERNRNQEWPDTKNSRYLEHLMNFLRKEVQGEEMVLLARSGFTPKEPHYNVEKDTPLVYKVNRDLAIVSALVSLDSEQKICGLIPKINKKILTDLKKRKITLSDSFSDATEIDLLIGADVMGKLITENVVELDFGLTAVESKLG